MKTKLKSIGLFCLLITLVLSSTNMFANNGKCKMVKSEKTLEVIEGKVMGDFVSVNEDGTLSPNNELFNLIPQEDREVALNSLDKLNENIESQDVKPFNDNDERLQSGFENVSASAGNCFCYQCPCAAGFCCASGWWLTCWRLGDCP